MAKDSGDILANAPVVGVTPSKALDKPSGEKGYPRSFGKYVLEKSLSRGGMGQVYLAIAKGLNRRCVIKTIRGDLTGEEEFVGRFADEAKIMVRMQHPNIVRVFDAGRVRNDYYIAMEFVHGRDLGDVLDRAYERGKPMPTDLGVYITEKVLEGLNYVHTLKDESGRPMGLIHRDISPQNVLIGFDGSVKLIDFGLARSALLPSRTQGALAIGKYGYMSPEQARHEKIDGRADVYSTGVMLFEVFTGDRLVDEQDQSTLWQRVLNPKHRKPSTVISTLPKVIDELVMRAVAVKVSDRFSSAEQMRLFAEQARGPDSNVDALAKYLKFLYPKVKHAEDPMPKIQDELLEMEKSVVFAVSREAVMSVFGRGKLPIEWTMEFDAKSVQEALRQEVKDRAREKAELKEVQLAATRPKVSTMEFANESPTEVTVRPYKLDEGEATWHEGDATIQPFKDEERTLMMSAPLLTNKQEILLDTHVAHRNVVQKKISETEIANNEKSDAQITLPPSDVPIQSPPLLQSPSPSSSSSSWVAVGVAAIAFVVSIALYFWLSR